MGILPFMSSALRNNPDKAEEIRLEFYGPPGLRKLIRTNLQITQPNISGKFRTHELLVNDDPTTSCEDSDLHENELPGRDIYCDEEGHWKAFESADGFVVDAGSLLHRVRCLGYIFTSSRGNLPPPTAESIPEASSPSAADVPIKLVILGDTSDPSGVEELAQDATVLVHEATNAWLPQELEDCRSTRTPEMVTEKAISRGHSTPAMAGAFAKKIRAKRLFLNHFSSKFQVPGPPSVAIRDPGGNRKAAIMDEIARQASEAWGLGEAKCARDLLWVEIDVPPRPEKRKLVAALGKILLPESLGELPSGPQQQKMKQDRTLFDDE